MDNRKIKTRIKDPSSDRAKNNSKMKIWKITLIKSNKALALYLERMRIKLSLKIKLTKATFIKTMKVKI